MSLEAVERISQVEGTNRERKAAAEAEAKQIVANAEREGLALLQQVRAAANDQGKLLINQAEERAEKRSAQITQAAQAEGEALKASAGKHLEEAAEFIVGRVVKS